MTAFRKILSTRTAGSPQQAWIGQIWPSRVDASTDIGFRAAFAGMARRLGPIALTDTDREALASLQMGRVDGWDLVMVGRVALLLHAISLVPHDQQADWVRRLYQRGDSREQAAILRALPFLPGPQRFLEIGVESCRTNVVDVFAALALDNPYPSRHFPTPNFNQMVLKAIFLALDTHHIHGLPGRTTRELQRMVSDFAAERRAAGRVVPADTDYILGLAAAS